MEYTTRRFAPAAAAMALVLTACGDRQSEGEAADANLAQAGEVAGVTPPDMVVFYPLGTVASLEPRAMRSEVERLQRERANRNPQAPQGPGGQTAEQKAGQSGGPGSGDRDGATGFASVDFDSDGRLSPAEYAIYNLPAETPARQGATHDEKAPFVSDEALNRSATSFRSLDANGDFFLTAEEFQTNAR